jgi:hypothetical protein
VSHLEQEGGEARARLVTAARQPEPQKHLLGPVFRFLPVPEKAEEERLDAVAVAGDQEREGLHVSLAGLAHQPDILLLSGGDTPGLLFHIRCNVRGAKRFAGMRNQHEDTKTKDTKGIHRDRQDGQDGGAALSQDWPGETRSQPVVAGDRRSEAVSPR